ncbi:MAG: DUF4384 domain-containing protein [Hyphomicrobiaceae bacterium]
MAKIGLVLAVAGFLSVGFGFAQTEPQQRKVTVQKKGEPPLLKVDKREGPPDPQKEETDEAGPPEPGAAPKGPGRKRPGEEAGVIPVPSEGAERKAYQVLDKHCARCHQVGSGRYKRERPAKDFGNILQLAELVRAGQYIQPGNPDASQLYTFIFEKKMPYDVYVEYSGDPEPTAEEVTAIRDWIQGLGPPVDTACKARPFLDNAKMLEAMVRDADNPREHRNREVRYVTLTHLYNACIDDKELEVYRQAVVKLLNSLSYSPDPLKLETIDEAGTIIRFRLADLGWDAALWEKLIKGYPYGVIPRRTKQYKFLQDVAGTKIPHVRGDWLANVASRPPLYHDLLHLPATFSELQKLLGVSVDANIRNFRTHRAGFQKSGVSAHNRLIERHTIANGVFWTSYDFAGSSGRQSLFEYPLGPGGKYGFKHDGGETIFSLPNGLNGYYLNDAAGKRLDKGPTNIVFDKTQRDLTVTNGVSCMGCHSVGFRKETDKIRAHVIKDRSFPADVRDHVEALYPPVEEMTKLIERDVERFRSAMRLMGLNPDLTYNGVEMVNALSSYYERDVVLKLAAAEFGLPAEEFLSAVEGAPAEVIRLKRRLAQGYVPRDQFQCLFAKVVPHVTDDTALVTEGYYGSEGRKECDPKPAAKKEYDPKPAAKKEYDHKPAAQKEYDSKPAGYPPAASYDRPAHRFTIELYSDKSAYKKGDLPVFSVRATEDCYLTLINIDSRGHAKVLFPNKFTQDNHLPAGEELRFPDHKAKFEYSLDEKGTEAVVAVCSTTRKTVDGIRHDFGKDQFTDLGDYRSFMSRAITVRPKGPPAYSPGPAGPPPGYTPPPPVRSGEARTAIKFSVY